MGLDENLVQKKPKFAIKNEADNGLSNSVLAWPYRRRRFGHVQFFVNVVDNAFLDHQGKQQDRYGYCVFGHVLEGMEVVDEIRAVKTGTRNGHSDVPVEPVFITSTRVLE